MNFITIDFETATFDRNSPCELGLTFVENWQIVGTKAWLIKPVQYPHFHYFNIGIHGIEPKMVSNEPEFDVIWKEVKPLIENQFLLAHNAGFDFSVLRSTLQTYDLEQPNLKYSCSCNLSKKVWEKLPAYNLKTLCKIHNIDLQHHRAAADSRATAELVIKALQYANVHSLEELPEKLNTTVYQLLPDGNRTATKQRYSKYRT